MELNLTVEKLSEVKALLRSAKEYENNIIAYLKSDNNYSGCCYVEVYNRNGIKRMLKVEVLYNNEVQFNRYVSVMNCKDLKDLENEILSTIQKVLINGK